MSCQFMLLLTVHKQMYSNLHTQKNIALPRDVLEVN